MPSPHALDPASVLRVAGALGGTCKRVILVACEPLDLGGEEGTMGLSAPVAASIEHAVTTVEELVEELISSLGPPGPLLQSGKDSKPANWKGA